MFRIKSIVAFFLWTALPIGEAALVTGFGVMGQRASAIDAPGWCIAALISAIVLTALLIAKSIRDRTRLPKTAGTPPCQAFSWTKSR